ncbi:MAG: AI-2E family transporter [Thermoguttaceae bacterium]
MRQQYTLLQIVLFLAAVVVILAGLASASAYVGQILLTVFFTVVLTIPLRWLKQKGFSNGVAVLMVSFFVLMGGLLLVGVVASSGVRFAAKLPEYQRKLIQYVDVIDTQINDLAAAFERQTDSLASTVSQTVLGPATPPVAEEQPADVTAPDAEAELVASDVHDDAHNDIHIEAAVPKTVEDEKASAMPTVGGLGTHPPRERFSIAATLSSLVIAATQSLISSMIDVASVAMIIVVLVVFALLEAAQFPAKIEAAFGQRSAASQQLQEIARTMVHYTVIKTVVSLGTGAAVTLAMWLVGVEYAVLWGLLACFLNFIPNFGPIIASVPPVLLSLVDGDLTKVALCTTALTCVHSISGYLVEPYYMGDGLGISPLVVLLSMVVWGWFFGMTGMFLSAPLTMAMKIVLDAYQETRWIAILLEDKPRTMPASGT